MFRRKVLSLAFGLFATPALAIDPCLVGVWEADADDMAHMLGIQMNATVEHTGGRTSIEIDEFGSMTALSEDMTYSVTMPDMPPFTITVVGFGEGAMNADDGRNFVANMPVYEMVGRAEILGEVMELPFSTGMPDTIPGRAEGLYGCSGDTASFDSGAGPIPRRWRRVR